MADQRDLMRELDRLEERIDAQVAKAQKTTTMSLVLGIIIVVIMIGYFSWASSYARQFLEPKTLSMLATDQVVTRIPEVRKTIEATAKAEVPVMVAGMVDSVVKEQIPAARKEAEKTIIEETTKALDKYEDQLLSKFDATIEAHRDNIKEMAAQLSTDEGRKIFEDDLYKLFEETIEAENMQADLVGYAQALKDIDETLAVLSDEEAAAHLTDEQLALRHLVALVREMSNRSEVANLHLKGSDITPDMVSGEVGGEAPASSASEAVDPEPVKKTAKPADAKKETKPEAKKETKPAPKK